jgi:prepilin-type N-terminal cleavage/methylation domain-containing protein
VRSLKRQSGFTLIELIVTCVIIGAAAGIAIPTFAVWLPNYRLKSAALDLFSSFQQAKMMAVRANADHSLEFDTTNNRYTLKDADGVIVKTVELSQYGNPGDISFGWGDATKNATDSGGTLPGGPVTFGASGGNSATFNPRGMGNAGYVYINNTKNASYAIGKESTGLIKMRKWKGSNWE